ncbi:MAG: hypothetical protein QM783_17850 [Phycisphaerales bacterium]
MNVEAIPTEVEKFLAREVRSLLALEMLVLLGAQRAERWTAEELSRELRATVEWAEGELTHLVERGLVEVSERAPGERVYGFAAAPGPGTEFALGWLVASYPARRFSIIQSLYVRPPAPAPAAKQSPAVQHFADAFDIRKEPKERKEEKGGRDG